ncbi:hypothetical protein [Crenobacter cavernae]|uniref:Uncharacterized protein n=1 Tax=Crenobacter cavernae TaxID=2290923 RepID=A0ABY0FEA6_9NEIS|nr:hypothetical protein [Crenobacter cavernae]RXZ43209.1 hypothetical protein EBB06_10605 [Crenobacter cavernae]
MRGPLKWALAATLAATVYVLFFDDGGETTDADTGLAVAPRAAGARKASAPAAWLSQAAAQEPVNLFAAQDWTPPPPPPPPAPKGPPPKSVAPPLPFSVSGDWRENGERVVFVGAGPLTIPLCARCKVRDAVHPGETLGGVYKLVALTPDGAQFIHLPTAMQQTLPLPSAGQ